MKITEKNIDKIIDGLGKPIEAVIKPLVLALNKRGYETTGSCQGHKSWSRTWPWVDVRYTSIHDIDSLEQILKDCGWEFGVLINGLKKLEIASIEIRPNFRKGNLRSWQRSVGKLSREL